MEAWRILRCFVLPLALLCLRNDVSSCDLRYQGNFFITYYIPLQSGPSMHSLQLVNHKQLVMDTADTWPLSTTSVKPPWISQASKAQTFESILCKAYKVRSKASMERQATTSWWKWKWVLLIGIILGSSSIGAVSEPLAVESSLLHRMGSRTRKVVEQAVVLTLKPDLSNEVKENIVQGFADLKATCPQWVLAESAGVVPEPNQLDGEGVGLFMRFNSEEDLKAFHASKQKHAMADKYILPYTTDMITMYFEAKVEDNDEAVHRNGDAFKNGAERIVGIKVKNGTSQEDMDTMVKAMNDLIDAPEIRGLLVQITCGANFCPFDQQFTHGIVVRCPSWKALQIYSKHQYHLNVVLKTVYPIAESLFQADYLVDSSGARKLIS